MRWRGGVEGGRLPWAGSQRRRGVDPCTCAWIAYVRVWVCAQMSERAQKRMKEMQMKKANTECFVCSTKVRPAGRGAVVL
jgi:hypothetical protein